MEESEIKIIFSNSHIIDKDNFETKKWKQQVNDPLFRKKTKNANLYYSPFKALSNTMKNGLISIFKADNTPLSKPTRNALIKRKLITENNEITELGYYNTVAAIGLKEQCSILKIEYSSAKVKYKGSVEMAALSYFEGNGWEGFYSEGTALFELLRGFIIEPLSQFAKETFEEFDRQEYEILRHSIFYSYGKNIRNQILNNILNYNTTDLSRSLERLKSIRSKETFVFSFVNMTLDNSNPYKKSFPVEKIVSLFENMDRELLRRIAVMCMDGTISPAGWPDLLVFKENSVKFVEVKKNDKLIFSQIFTIETLINMGAQVSVFKVK
jgi:hypothetical protein